MEDDRPDGRVDAVGVDVLVESTPQGARVYLVPLGFWEENGEEALLNDENRLRKFRVPEGITNSTTEQEEAVFVAVFFREGKRAILPCDVTALKRENKCVATGGDWK